MSAIEVVPTKSQNGIKVLGLKTRAEKKEEFLKTEDCELVSRVKNIAVNAFMDLGARDFAQIDIKTNSYGHCFFMGANLLPDIKDESSYLVKAFEIEHGYSYNKIIEIIVDKGISRV
ncbi:hypothetical protein [Candidatus Sulfurimonas baltica]|uniref:D-alanine--D-alanine ligase C-terminal domain-containing protein n=1 Tax=Candidatus Sulfurimonas baltica TaxID=2740404 RepID=A0A7S7LUE5_9BACT|nr:hypothetical protein [Candidatus Sulfurimonas baltica]QOY50884.1 hypothetical protein HUE88_06945 [Candidatus Sulfurimonas baltica]